MSFAPPASLNTPAVDAEAATGDDAYARRLRLSGINPQEPHYPRPPDTIPPPPPPPPESELPYQAAAAPPPPPPTRPPATISKAPVRYNLPAPPEEIPKSEAELASALRREEELDEQDDRVPDSEDTQRSRRPGQQGFAQRLMSKYGWTKGSGLGADGSGIVNPLRVQVEKQKKKPDSEGGGFVGPGGMGKIIGGKKKGGAEGEGGKFGPMSEVIVLRGMVDGMDLDVEMEGAGDGGLMQEIGEECSEKVGIIIPHPLLDADLAQQYGRVERVFIDRSNPASAPVFVKFTSQLSALRVSDRAIPLLRREGKTLISIPTGSQCARRQDLQRQHYFC